MKRIELFTGDVVKHENPDSFEEEIQEFEVLGTEEFDDDNDMLVCREEPVVQALAIKYTVPSGRVGVAMVTDNFIDLLLPLCSPIEWQLVKTVAREGKEINV